MKRCVLAVMLILVFSLTGCKPNSTDVEQSDVSEIVNSETVSNEETDWRWLYTEGAELAKSYVEDSKYPQAPARDLETMLNISGMNEKIDGVGLIVVSSSNFDKDSSTDNKYYWKIKGHFYGEDEYGHTIGDYNFELKVYSFGYPTSSNSFYNDISDITVSKS